MTIGNHNCFFIPLSGTLDYVAFTLMCCVWLGDPLLVYCGKIIRSPWPWGGVSDTEGYRQ